MVSTRPIIQCSLLNVDMILVHHVIVLVIVVVLSVGLVDIQQFVLVIVVVLSVGLVAVCLGNSGCPLCGYTLYNS